VPFVAGRDFNADDRAGAPRVAIVNQEFVRLYLPGQSAVGGRFQLDDSSDTTEIVGVVRDSTLNDLREEKMPVVFLPFAQFPNRFNHVFLKTAGSGTDVISAVRPAIRDVNPRIRVERVERLDTALARTLSQDILLTRLTGTFGTAAIALVCFGVYGVISYLVVTRTKEIGIRIAIGAPKGAVVRDVIRDALWTVIPGLVIGILTAAALGRLIASQLFESSPHDPITLGTVALLLLVVTVLSAYGPARRAAHTSPLNALRGD
jgi:putative ABC transport system permease protein